MLIAEHGDATQDRDHAGAVSGRDGADAAQEARKKPAKRYRIVR
jgi:hypothetical protein